jgi:hypothetical protein
MEKDWVKVYSSSFLPSVEIVKHLLESKGIETILLNQQDSLYVSIGEIHLLVKREQAVTATSLISKSEM